MKIAALILAHDRPDLLNRLTNRLNGDLWNIYIHLDKKSNPKNFSGIHAKAFLHIHRVNWGGYSTSAAILSLIERALVDQENTHFYLMSGQCFPVKTDTQISEIVSNNSNCIEFFKMPVWHKPLERLTQWHFIDGPPHLRGRRTAQKLLNHFPRNTSKLLRGIQPYGGSMWWLLNRPSLEQMMQFVKQNAWFPKAYRYSLLSDEMFFQTLAMHVGVKADRPSPTFAKWVAWKPHPQNINEEILSEAKSGWHLMARKFVN